MPATQVSKSQCIELQSNPGYYLLKDAAYAWDRSVAAFGKLVLITGSWRSYETQLRIFEERYDRGNYSGRKVNGIQYTTDVRYWPAKGAYYTRRAGTAAAAVPGTSNHGGGVAVDVKTKREKGDPPYEQAVIFGSWTDTDRTRFLRVAAEHGWDDDEGRAVGELWHLTYYPARDKHRGKKPTTTIQEELDMTALDPTQAAHLRDINARTKELLEKVLELHSGVAPAIDRYNEDGGEKITLRRAIKETRLAVTGQLLATVTKAVEKALAGTPGVDKAAITTAVTTAVATAMADAIDDTEYVLTPKES